MATLLATVLILRWLAQGLGPEEFGAYSLARRFVSTVAPLATLAMGVALPRYLGLYHLKPQAQYSYLIGAVLIATTATSFLVVLALLFQEEFSFLLFHKTHYVSLLLASLLMLFGFAVYSILYGYYRGIGKIRWANLWQLALMALGPLVVVGLLIEKSDAAGIVAALGGLFMVSVVPVGYLCFKGLSAIRLNPLGSTVKELIRYGGPRTPGGLAFAGLLTMAPFLAPYFGSLKEAGYLVIGQSMFRIIEGAIVAFGIVALPRVARYMGEGREKELKEHLRDLITFIFQVGLFLSLHLFLWAELLIQVWLGPEYQGAIPLMRVIVLTLPAYLSYVMLRSIIDAVEVNAVNTINVFIGLGVALVTGFVLANLGLGALGLAIGTTVGFLTLGILSVIYVVRRYRCAPEMVQKTLIVNGLFFLMAWVAYRWLITGQDLISLASAIGLESVLFLGYLLLLQAWKVGWMQQISVRIGIK